MWTRFSATYNNYNIYFRKYKELNLFVRNVCVTLSMLMFIKINICFLFLNFLIGYISSTQWFLIYWCSQHALGLHIRFLSAIQNWNSEPKFLIKLRLFFKWYLLCEK